VAALNDGPHFAHAAATSLHLMLRRSAHKLAA
jgi:hypothetical protein